MSRHELQTHLISVATIGLAMECLGPPLVSAQHCSDLVGQWSRGPSDAVAVSGDYVFFGSGPSMLIADVSQPAAPQVVGEITLFGEVKGIEVVADLAFVANGAGGLRVIDVSDPSMPIELGSSETVGHAEELVVAGDYAFVAENLFGFEVFDISSRPHPRMSDTALVWPGTSLYRASSPMF
jgi:hypothetical protein